MLMRKQKKCGSQAEAQRYKKSWYVREYWSIEFKEKTREEGQALEDLTAFSCLSVLES